MDALSMHYCFQLIEEPTSNQDLLSLLQTLPGEFLETVGTVTNVDINNGDRLILATDTLGSHLLIHIYRGGLVTIDIQYTSTKHNNQISKQQCSFAVAKANENRIKEMFKEKCEFTRSLPTPILRGKVCPYFHRGEDNLFEHKDIDLVYEKDSQWQNIKIYRSPNFGAMLCLDDVIMLAESDDVYTQTLLGTNPHRNGFKDKTVLILGGGDGGLLCELLKHSPKFVQMVEIEVIKACRTYMKGVCNDCMDQLSGDNYKIQIDDCLNVLQECLKNKTKFDYIINDLSEFLINTGIGYDLDFVSSAKILEISMVLLDHGGKYLSRGDDASCERALQAFESDITKNHLEYNKYTVDVPSFCGKYCLYEVLKPSQTNGVA